MTGRGDPPGRPARTTGHRYSSPIGRSPSRPRAGGSARRPVAYALALVSLAGISSAVARAEPAAAAATTSSFRAAERPCRLADVRNGTGFQRLDATIVRVPVVGHCGVPADATAVALTVTVDAARARDAGYVSIWPEGAAIPTASVVNHWAGEVRANGTIVGLSSTGTLAVLSLTGAPVIVDVTGWFVPETTATAGRFMPISPTRAIDTREAPRAAPLTAGETITVPLPPGVPADAAAVAVTVTAVAAPAPSFLSIAPGGTGRPPSSVLNTDAAGQIRAAGAIVGVTTAGFDVYSLNGGHVVVDVTGWFTGASAPAGTDGLFVAEPAPRRLLDTRSGDPIWAGGGTEVANVAANSAALALNVTIVQPRAPGFVTAYPARQALPRTSTVNGPTTREVAASLAIVPTSTAGVGLYSSGGADVVVDITGWFTGTPGSPTGGPPTNVRPPECTTSADPDGLSAFFRTGAAFTGADYQRSFLLPDGRVLWFFQDVYVRGRGNLSTFVHNAALVQNGGCFTVLHSGTFAAPRELLFAAQTQQQRHWFWPLAGEVGADGLFHLFVAEMRENGPSYLHTTEPITTWKVAIDLTTMSVVDQRPAVDASASLYGWSVTSDSSYTYLYAHCHRQFGWSPFPFVDPPVYVHDFGCVQRMTVARVPKGDFGVPLQYWNGSTWGSDPAAAVNVVPGGRLVSASQMYNVGGRYIAITKVGDWFGQTIEIDVATQPQGPFTTVRTLSAPPRCPDCNNYFATILPYAARDGSWIVGISNNVFGPVDLSRYDPTFFPITPV